MCLPDARIQAMCLDNENTTFTLSCHDTSMCSTVDINMVCMEKNCVCRKDMKWNSKALECQVKI